MDKDISNVKKFIGVKFHGYGESNDVIPKNWITVWNRKVKQCKYPNINAMKLAKKRIDVEEEWKTYKLIALCHANTYDKCASKLYSTVNVESSSMETENCSRTDMIEASFKPNSFMTPATIDDKNTSACNCAEKLTNFEATLKEFIALQRSMHTKIDMLLIKGEERNVSLKCLPPPASHPVDAARQMIRRLMTRNLAVCFSLTGLGDKRQHCKHSFKDHAISQPVIDAITAKHKIDIKETLAVIRVVLKGSRDWDGGRKCRAAIESVTATPSSSSDASLHHTAPVANGSNTAVALPCIDGAAPTDLPAVSRDDEDILTDDMDDLLTIDKFSMI